MDAYNQAVAAYKAHHRTRPQSSRDLRLFVEKSSSKDQKTGIYQIGFKEWYTVTPKQVRLSQGKEGNARSHPCYRR